MRVLITGGAGFVGAHLARSIRRDDPTADIVCLDNLKRRGAEINIGLLRAVGITFVHGDIRVASDLATLEGSFDLLIEASAEPSVLAGIDGSPDYLLQTNLLGTLNCLEFSRRRVGAVIFLSTSRVYSIAPLRSIPLVEADTRLTLSEPLSQRGMSSHGIAEDFPTDSPRSLYGASKRASELFVQEYVDTYGMRAVINRCGVIAGAGQFGKVDQGVFTLWVANHHFGLPLRYTGFGGTGKQVRDLLHPEDLHRLIGVQYERIDALTGGVFNVGGGIDGSVSLAELTGLCEAATGRRVPIASVPDSASVDMPWYCTDNRRVTEMTGWAPQRRPVDIVGDIERWIAANETLLAPIFAPEGS